MVENDGAWQTLVSFAAIFRDATAVLRLPRRLRKLLSLSRTKFNVRGYFLVRLENLFISLGEYSGSRASFYSLSVKFTFRWESG